LGTTENTALKRGIRADCAVFGPLKEKKPNCWKKIHYKKKKKRSRPSWESPSGELGRAFQDEMVEEAVTCGLKSRGREEG